MNYSCYTTGFRPADQWTNISLYYCIKHGYYSPASVYDTECPMCKAERNHTGYTTNYFCAKHGFYTPQWSDTECPTCKTERLWNLARELPYGPVPQESYHPHPYKCPICEGDGKITNKENGSLETCPTCEGKRIVWG